ncbi:MAG: glycosyltransferase [Gammaproteobacteria bacterium SG8_31]|nr:MAG: glycosyltransferase [Gammaproteobacteria bacterium SG8_31]
MMRLTIAVPCYNEAEVLPMAIESLNGVLERLVSKGKIDPRSKVVFIDDGSADATWEAIESAAKTHAFVGGLKLAGNCGHQNALLAGLMSLEGDAIVTLDADLQDDPAVIEQMLDAHKAGFEIVLGVRRAREKDSWHKRASALAYYRLLRLLGVRSQYNHADFRLMGRRSIEVLREFGEVNVFLRGLVGSLGFRTSTVYYERSGREAGSSKYSMSKMAGLAVEGIVSFSTAPLHAVAILGLLMFLGSLLISMWALWVVFFTDRAVPGWASSVLPMYLLGGIQLLSLGVIGEYVGKTYFETKRRPRFVIEKSV